MRYIGIELEFIIDNLNCFEKNLKDKNIPYIFVNIKRKNQLFDIFKLIKDNSIKAGKRESIEINTPIMDVSNITRFKEFLSSLDLNTIYLEDSCAFHLHIDCRNIGREKIENLFVIARESLPPGVQLECKVQNDVIVGATIGRPPVQHCATETDERCSPLQATD